MTKTMNHSNCTHPATKSGRAACRKARAARDIALANEVQGLIDAYFANEGDVEEILLGLAHIFPEVKAAYFDLDLDPEEIIALARELA